MSTGIHPNANEFAEFLLKDNRFDLNSYDKYSYQSLSVCIIDCVYSLRANYENTKKIVKKYADEYLDGDENAAGETSSMLIKHIDEKGGPEGFAEKFLGNRQVSGGVLKSIVCKELAEFLKCLNIETIDNFKQFPHEKLLNAVISSVDGIGIAGTSYLFMLCGYENYCKPDTHLKKAVNDGCKGKINVKEYNKLLVDTVVLIKEKNYDKYRELTPCRLDNVIWKYYSKKEK